jgi:hypothetical protein
MRLPQLSSLAVIPIQAAVGHLLGFGGLTLFGLSGARGLVFIAAGNVAGVVGGGLLAERLMDRTGGRSGARLAAAAAGWGVGLLVAALVGVLEYRALLFPLAGCIAAFHSIPPQRT